MPERFLREEMQRIHYRGDHEDLRYLARWFCVSREAMAIRLREFGWYQGKEK